MPGGSCPGGAEEPDGPGSRFGDGAAGKELFCGFSIGVVADVSAAWDFSNFTRNSSIRRAAWSKYGVPG